MLGALGRAESFEACCQWALLSVQITRRYTLRFKFTVHKYIYSSVRKVHAVSFRVFRNPPNSDMDYYTGSLTCVRDHSYACVYTLGLTLGPMHCGVDPRP